MYREKDNKKVNILGTDYSIVFAPETDERLKAMGADGLTDSSVHEITVGYFKPKAESIKDLSAYQKKVLRHEIIHAFLYESGLAESSVSVGTWAQNEEMIDWIARQYKKIYKAIKKAGAL